MPHNETPKRATYRHIIWDNPLFMFPLALLCAVITWLVVTMYFDNNGNTTINNVSVNFNYQSSAYTSLDLDIVDLPQISNVSVRVEGNNTLIGNMRAEDIMVYPNYAAVSGPGEITLGLQARITNNDYMNQGIELTVERPQSVTLVFDSVTWKTVPVTADTSGITIAEGFTLNRVVCVPAEVTLRGPASELELIDKVVAPVSTEEQLQDTFAASAVLEMRDVDGSVLQPRYTTMDAETADLTLTIYQVRELPLAVDFIGAPVGFDPRSLSYSLSSETLRVAGPARIVSTLTELTVTSFDLSQEFAFGRDYQRQIQLPSGIFSQEGIGTVTLSFDTANMASKELNIENIRMINVPSNYDVEVLTSLVSGVTLYGPANELRLLTADSVLAQVDCQSLTLMNGQQVVPVTIQIPASSRIFAVGNYTVECLVSER